MEPETTAAQEVPVAKLLELFSYQPIPFGETGRRQPGRSRQKEELVEMAQPESSVTLEEAVVAAVVEVAGSSSRMQT